MILLGLFFFLGAIPLFCMEPDVKDLKEKFNPVLEQLFPGLVIQDQEQGSKSPKSSSSPKSPRKQRVTFKQEDEKKLTKLKKKGLSTTCDVLPGLGSEALSSELLVGFSTEVQARQGGKQKEIIAAPSKKELKTHELFEAVRTINPEIIQKTKILIEKYGADAIDPQTGDTLLHELIKQLGDLESKFKLTGSLLLFYISKGRLDKIDFGAKNNKGETAADIIGKAQKSVSSLLDEIGRERLLPIQTALEATFACDEGVRKNSKKEV